MDWDITHSPKHWSTKQTMIQYVETIIVLFVERTRESLGEGEDKAAVIIMDNFKGQITPAMNEILEKHNIHTCLLPLNTTDRLQPLDLSVNKVFLREEFQKWYSEQIMQQLDNPAVDLSTAELQPVDLGMAAMKEITDQWLVNMADYITNNPQFIVNGFIHSGISKALDGGAIDDLYLSVTNESDPTDETSSDGSDEDDAAAIDYIVL